MTDTKMFDESVTKGVLWNDPKTIQTAINRIATSHSDKAIPVKFGSLCFDKGQQSKANAEAPSIAAEWALFVAKHYAGDRNPPGEKSTANYIAGYGGIAALGFHSKVYDTAPVFEFMFAKPSRKLMKSADSLGAFCRRVIEAHPTTAPTIDQLSALLPKVRVETAGDAIDDLEDMAVAAFGVEGKYRKVLANDAALGLIVLDMLALISAAKKKMPREAASDGVDYAALAAARRAEIDYAKSKA